MSASALPAEQIQRLLNHHARSFALTLRFLPRELREPLGLAYLLARASDTVADAVGISRKRRLLMLEELKDALGSESFRWKPTFTEGELSESELKLIAAVPALLAMMERHSGRGELLQLWQTILKGQIFDLGRFIPEAPPLVFEELEEYCYLVAGSVGEAWTRLIANHAPRIFLRPHAEMEKLGIGYGKGLQLLNILRDRAEDRAQGRLYLPEEAVPKMMEQASEWLTHGEEYCLHLRPGRIRYASELPLRLAWRTLDRMSKSPESPRVKILRWEVYAVLLKTLPSLGLRSLRNPVS